MKKLTLILTCVACAGFVVSGMLWMWHYYPDTSFGAITCARGIYNPCVSAGGMALYAPFGIPLPVFCLFVYIYTVFSLLIADYAGGRYPLLSIAIAVPLTGVMLLWELAVAVAAALEGQVFSFVHTVAVAIALATCCLCVVLYRSLAKQSDSSFGSIIKNIFKTPDDNHDRKAAVAYSTLFVFMLAAALVSANLVLKEKNPARNVSSTQLQAFLDGYYSSEEETLALPQSNLVLGKNDAKLTVVVFTDFLCSACGSFYETEKYITERFSGNVKFAFYHYPLDATCNVDVEETVYENSCLASAAFEAAAATGVLAKYTAAHFASHEELAHGYNKEKATAIASAAGLTKDEMRRFEEYIDSGKAKAKIQEDIAAAIKLKIDGTPTIYVEGRAMTGVPPKELFELLVKDLLSK